jgi:multidrug transporter EmrE-like cation transporter
VNGIKLVALIMIVAGVLGLAYGSFTYTQDTHTTQVGPIKLSVKDEKTVNVPVWAGAGLVIAGIVLLVVRGKN